MAEAEDATAGKQAAEEPAGEQPKPSLFPVFPLSSQPSLPKSASSDVHQWLSNPSFTPSISSLPRPSTAQYTPFIDESDGSDADEIPSTKPRTYELLDSSSPSDRETDRDKREKSKKKKKRKRSRERLDDPSRRSGVRAWVGSGFKPDKDYYFDSRGDRDNMAFGCLYRMDIARYKLYNPVKSSGSRLYHWKQRNSGLDGDGDVDALDNKVREAGRYFSTKHSALERRKDFKRVRILAAKKHATNTGEFIPLIELQTSHGGGSSELQTSVQIEESWEDEILRKTKEFNKMSRETPHDETVWLAYAEFQDKVASKQPQKAARLQTLEKKISILEKAVKLNPDSEDLLICLLKAYQKRDSTEILMERWETILKQHSGSCKLWKEFLCLCQGEFSRFKVSDVRKMYAFAIQALSAARSKLCRQVHHSGNQLPTDQAFIQLELGLVDVFVSLCRFEWQAGYQEIATGLFQAELDYSLFCPSLLLTEQSKQRLFEHFWNSDGARIGEDGALGWSAWLEREEDIRQKVSLEDTSPENEVGLWTGWLEPVSKNSEPSKESEQLAEYVVGDEDTGEDFETEDTRHEEEDVESLLKKLGISVDADTDTEVNDPATWNKWSEEEASRDCKQWMPVRDNSGTPFSSSGFMSIMATVSLIQLIDTAEAVLVAEELFTTRMKSVACSVTPSRALAKLLLKNDRQDLLLCGVYARSEAAFGNIDLARRVFDMALSSIEGLPSDLQGNAPLLYFWYAEIEVAACASDSKSDPSISRAIHILSCLGSGASYTPFKCATSSLQLLKARQGFREQIKKLQSAWSKGNVKDESIALICSSALLEDLTIGWGAGVSVLEAAFSMTLPERRIQSFHLESLLDYCVRMLQKHLQHLKPSIAWKTILQGLQTYPYNPRTFTAFVEIGCLYTVPNKLRQIFDEYCNKKPSVVVWLFALSFELGKSGSQHRIRGLFERALANDHLQKSVILWRCYLAYELNIAQNASSARRIFFRAIHACPWSKKLWLDGFVKLYNVLTARELSDLQEVMRDKELHLRTDIYEILLQDDS
ncbi:hypothetical protein ACLOJK_025527 [Asimina triloba]